MHGARPRTAKLRGILVAMQVALTLVLLAGSVTMGRSFLHLLDTGMGFRTDHLVAVSVSLAGTGEQSDARKSAEYARRCWTACAPSPASNPPPPPILCRSTTCSESALIKLESGRESSLCSTIA